MAFRAAAEVAEAAVFEIHAGLLGNIMRETGIS